MPKKRKRAQERKKCSLESSSNLKISSAIDGRESSVTKVELLIYPSVPTYSCDDKPQIRICDSHELPRQVLRHSDNRSSAENDYAERIFCNFRNFSNEYCQCNTNISGEARRELKTCRSSGEKNDRSRSRRRRKVPQRQDSDSQEDSGSSSGSSSDLRSSSRHVNRHILSRLVQYTFYSVVNTGVTMDQGTSASALCRSFLALFLKLDENSVYSQFLDTWDRAGQKIIVLKGYNHKHLQYLAKEVRHIAVESNTLYRTTGQARVMLVLTAFGREEDMEEAFDDLCYLH